MSPTPPLEGSDDNTAALLPGSPQAVAHGCRCSTLANAAYRLRAERFPLIDPDCVLHSTVLEPAATNRSADGGTAPPRGQERS